MPVTIDEAIVYYSEMLDLNICLVSLNGWYYVCLYRLLSFEKSIKWSWEQQCFQQWALLHTFFFLAQK